jgi:hypothetical protein
MTRPLTRELHRYPYTLKLTSLTLSSTSLPSDYNVQHPRRRGLWTVLCSETHRRSSCQGISLHRASLRMVGHASERGIHHLRHLGPCYRPHLGPLSHLGRQVKNAFDDHYPHHPRQRDIREIRSCTVGLGHLISYPLISLSFLFSTVISILHHQSSERICIASLHNLFP